jgi:hypothetical protein
MENRGHSGACLFRWFNRSRDDLYMGSEEISGKDQQQNPQSRRRNQKLAEANAARPKLSGSAHHSLMVHNLC